MGESIEKNIKQAIDILSNPESLRQILSIFESNNTKKEVLENVNNLKRNEVITTNEVLPTNNENQITQEPEKNTDTLHRFQKAINIVNNNNDPRVNLLNAISPFLNGKRQNAINNCIKMLNVTKIVGIFGKNSD